MGQFVDAVGAHDYNVTQTLVMLVVLVAAVVNLAIDIIYGWHSLSDERDCEISHRLTFVTT